MTIVLPEPDVETLMSRAEQDPSSSVTVDLESKTITVAASNGSSTIDASPISLSFDIDDYSRWRLMEGLDDIGLTLRNVDKIDAYEAARPAYKPTTK